MRDWRPRTDHKMNVAAALIFLIFVTAPAMAQDRRTPLKNVSPDQVVRDIAYCKGEYRVTMASGETRTIAEINLRFKTDSTAYGPQQDKPVMLPAGMRGDRAQIIFTGPEELRRFVVERCEGGS